MYVGDSKQLRPAAAAGPAASVDESADIRFPCCNHAVKGRCNLFEAFKRLNVIDVALAGIDVGLRSVKAGDSSIVFRLLVLDFLN
jgi:hypothetical protein